MRVVNTDALLYVHKSPEKCLHEAEMGKKKMYLGLASSNVDTSPPL